MSLSQIQPLHFQTNWLVIHSKLLKFLMYSTMINLQLIILLLCFTKQSCTHVVSKHNNLFLTKQQESIFTHGVPVDYSINEATSRGGPLTKFTSAPGCPVSTEPGRFELHGFNRNFWVQYGSSKRCYLVGTQGPCPHGTLMGPLVNSKHGICVCSCFFNGRTKPFQPTEHSVCYNSDENQHHAFMKGKCHTILSQGPCKWNEVLLFDQSKKIPTCKHRECPKRNAPKLKDAKFSFGFKINNICHGVGDQCELNPKATSRSRAGFYSSFSFYYYEFDVEPANPFPSCVRKSRGPFYVASALNEHSCNKQLEKFSQVLKKCVPSALFGRRSNIG